MNAHLAAELRWLDLLLRRAVGRLRAATDVTEHSFLGLYIPDSHVDALLDGAPPHGEADAALTGEIVALRETIDARFTDSPLLRIQRLFGLTEAERACLVLAAAPALDLRYEALYGYVQNDAQRKHATVDLALRLFAMPRPRFRVDAPLFRTALLHLVPPTSHAPLPAHALRIDERVVDAMLGGARIDARLTDCVILARGQRTTDELVLPAQLRRALRETTGLLTLVGRPGVGRRTIARAWCAERGWPVLEVDLPRADVPLPILVREARLADAALYLGGYTETQIPLATLTAVPEQLGRPLLLGVEQSIPLEPLAWSVAIHQIEIPPPDLAARRQLWHAALRMPAAAADVDAVASAFALTPRQIAEAAADVDRTDAVALMTAARRRCRHRLGELATHVARRASWDDIVLPKQVLQQLREVRAWIRYRGQVLDDWGMARHTGSARGLAVLFSGSSGTGKTLAASILANDVGLDLYRVDLATVVSKYIGETEKNLGRVFQEAESSNAVLFFDEADALFGKRSEVRDAHDRYANLEVAYLLQKVEGYDGVVILATNLRRNLDEAFARRLHHVLEFPLPDAKLRERIWRQHLPAQVPVGDDVDLSFMATRFETSGGHIRNAALAAAYLAAAEGGAVRMEHLVVATARELQKQGKLPAKTDFGPYYGLLRGRI